MRPTCKRGHQEPGILLSAGSRRRRGLLQSGQWCGRAPGLPRKGAPGPARMPGASFPVNVGSNRIARKACRRLARSASQDDPARIAHRRRIAGTPRPSSPDAPAGPKVPARAADTPSKQPDTNWIVSETTSPVDYSPLITAVMRVPSDVKDAPTTLTVCCRGGRTELLVHTEGTWRPSRHGELQVSYQINDQPLVKLEWSASADGKSASYKDDAVDFLRSLPEGARLKITVLDGLAPALERRSNSADSMPSEKKLRRHASGRR